MKRERLKQKELIAAIHKRKGKVGLIAEQMQVTTRTIYLYAKRYPNVQAAIEEARAKFDETLIDSSEMKLQTAIMAGEAWAIKFTLSTKGKERGYVTRKEVDHQIDVRELSDEQLQAIIDGESPS